MTRGRMMTPMLPTMWAAGLLLWACLCPVQESIARPLPHIMVHQNIVMTLHGMMDHVDVEGLKESTRVRERQSVERFMALNQNDSHQAIPLFSAVDVDGDGRMMLDELVAWTFTLMEQIHRRNQALASVEFNSLRVLGMAHGPIDAAAGVTRDLVVHSANVIVHFPSLQVLEHWADAVDGNRDNILNATEYFQLRFPEYSPLIRRHFASSFVAEHDTNVDGVLSQQEFLNATLATLTPGDEWNSARAYDFRSEEKEWRRWFASIDLNNDHTLDVAELVEIVSPSHLTHAVTEAYDIFVDCDKNGDHELTLQEFQSFESKIPQFFKRLSLHDQSVVEVAKIYGRMQSRLQRHVRHHDEL
eukprot:m.165789 g.165789  ORF g.165789 m.165789 type:complete len:358 (+) comp14434_c0_seq1:259-1332(+)